MAASKKKAHPRAPASNSGEPFTTNTKEGQHKVSHSNRTWQTNAAEFAALDRGEGWQFAVLVACSVEPGAGGHDRAPSEKVGTKRFAAVADTSHNRVARYFDAWQEAAARGWVPDASTLTPADAHLVEIPEQPWRAKDGGVYDASKTGGQINNTEQIADKAARDPEYAARVLGAVTDAAPDTARQVMEDRIERDSDTRTAADRAIERHFKHKSKPETKTEATPNDERAENIALIVKLRAAHRNISEAAGMASDIRGVGSESLRQAVLAEVEFIRSACDVLELSAKGDSFDDQLAALLDAEAGL